MKTVFITGASRGIGKAVTQRFLLEGYFVIGTSRSGSSDLCHENFFILPLELTEEKSRVTCSEQLKQTGKTIDIFINNAGLWHPKDDKEMVDVAVLKETLEANLIGPVDLTEKLLPLMNEGGHIINISSRRGSMSYTTEGIYPCYGISKAALNMFTRSLAGRLNGKVTVSSIHPGFVKTDMNEGEGDRTPEEAAEEIYQLAISDPETGQFWHQGERFPW